MSVQADNASVTAISSQAASDDRTRVHQAALGRKRPSLS